ncbi:hypothetical protein [Taibaiella soli]|nr:hypothetical protein [Taibaiella soli]
MKQGFDFNDKHYEFKYFTEADKQNGIFLIELFDNYLNNYTPRYFIVCYKDHKVSFKAVNAMDFDIKSAIVKSIMRAQNTVE